MTSSWVLLPMCLFWRYKHFPFTTCIISGSSGRFIDCQPLQCTRIPAEHCHTPLHMMALEETSVTHISYLSPGATIQCPLGADLALNYIHTIQSVLGLSWLRAHYTHISQNSGDLFAWSNEEGVQQRKSCWAAVLLHIYPIGLLAYRQALLPLEFICIHYLWAQFVVSQP